MNRIGGKIQSGRLINRYRVLKRFPHRVCEAFLIVLPLLWILTVDTIAAAENRENLSVSSDNQYRKNQPTKLESFKISVDVNLVTTDVTVVGKPLSQLSAEDFIIYDDTVAQETTHFSYDQLPIAVALLIDQSGSVKPFFPRLQISSLLALRNLKPEDQVALFSFADSCTQRVKLTPDRLSIAEKISKIQAGGNTNIYGALQKTARYLHENAPDRRRAIILVSDNIHCGTDPDVKRTLNELLEASVALYSIRTRPPAGSIGALASSSFAQVMIGPDTPVKEIAEMTGGELLKVDAGTSLQTALSEAIKNIRYQYTIGFSPSDPGKDGSYHKLLVKLATQDRCPGCKLRTRKGYYAGVAAPMLSSKENQPTLKESPEKTDELLIQRSIVTAGTTRLDLPDVPFTVKTVEQPKQNGRRQLTVRLNIDPAGIGFNTIEGRHDCNLQVAVFYADRSGKVLDYDWRKLTGRFSTEDYNRIVRDGISHTASFPLEAEDPVLKVVVYDAVNNSIGSKFVSLAPDTAIAKRDIPDTIKSFSPITTSSNLPSFYKALSEWTKTHPKPPLNAGAGQQKAYLKEQLEFFGQWERRIPENMILLESRFKALASMPDTSDKVLIREGDRILDFARSSLGSIYVPVTLKVMQTWADRGISPDRILSILSEFTKQQNRVRSPLSSPIQSNIPTTIDPALLEENRLWIANTGVWLIEITLYTRTGRIDRANEILSKWDKALNERRKKVDEMQTSLSARLQRPSSSNTGNPSRALIDNLVYSMVRGFPSDESSYYEASAKIAAAEGRSLDALTFYQSALRNFYENPALSFDFMDIEKRNAAGSLLWQELGGTRQGWESWTDGIQPKQISAAGK